MIFGWMYRWTGKKSGGVTPYTWIVLGLVAIAFIALTIRQKFFN